MTTVWIVLFKEGLAIWKGEIITYSLLSLLQSPLKSMGVLALICVVFHQAMCTHDFKLVGEKAYG